MSTAPAKVAEPPLAEWIDLGYAINSQDPRWIAPPRAKLERAFSGGDPFLARVPHRRFLSRDAQGRPAAKCAALVNPKLVDGDGRPYGQIGWFDARDDERAVAALLEEARAWLAGHGCARVLAPINGSTWHSYRIVVSGFDGPPPYLLEPWNPPYYARLLERCGFERRASYYSAEASATAMADGLAEKRAACEAAGYAIAPAPVVERLEEVLRTVWEISCTVFAGNLFYSEITFEDFRALYDGVERLIEPDLVNFARDPSGKIVGFGFGYPDIGDAVRAMRGEQGALAKLRFVAARALGGRARRCVAKTVGVLPEARGAQVGSALTHSIAAGARAGGYEQCVHALILDENVSGKISQRGAGKRFRGYALFERAVA